MQMFAPDELSTAVAFYRSIDDPTAKAVLDVLVDHPDQRFDGAAIVAMLGLGRHCEVARAAFRLGRLAAAVGRVRPWNESQLGYSMPLEQAQVLRRARDLVGATRGGS